MNANEIKNAIETRIAEIDAQLGELANERRKLKEMLARDEPPTRVERFGEIELPPVPGPHFQATPPYVHYPRVFDDRFGEIELPPLEPVCGFIPAPHAGPRFIAGRNAS